MIDQLPYLPVQQVFRETPVLSAIAQMHENQVECLGVVETNGQLAGLFSSQVVIELIATGQNLAELQVAEVMRSPKSTVTLDHSPRAIPELLARQNHIPVVDATNHLIGLTNSQVFLKSKLEILQLMSCESPGLVYIYDIHQKQAVFSNYADLRILGYAPETWTSKKFVDLIHSEDLPRFYHHLRSAQTWLDGTAHEFEYRLQDCQGNWRWFTSHDLVWQRNSAHQVQQIAGIAVEISRIKENHLRQNHEISTQLAQEIVAHTGAREALLLEEDQFQKIVCAMGSYQTDAYGKLITISPKFCQMLGYAPEQLQQSSVVDLIFPEDLPSYQRNFEQLLAGTATDISMECRYYHANGSVVWVNIWLSGVAGSQGKLDGILAITQDISKHKQVELSLNWAEARTNAMFEQAAVGINLCNSRGQFIQVNQKLCQMYGYDREELLQKTWMELTYTPDLEANLELEAAQIFTNQRSYTIEKRIKNRRGNIFWANVTISPLQDPGSGEIYTIAIVQDITDRKIAEQELKRSETWLQTLFDGFALGIAIGNSCGKLIRVNQTYADILGYGKDEVTGKTWMELTHPADIAKDLSYERQVQAGMLPSASIEKRMICKDGTIIWVSLTIRLIKDPITGEEFGVAAIADITSRKSIEAELKVSEAKFRDLVESADSLIFQLSLSAVFYYISPACQKLLGYSPAELEGSMALSLIHPDDRPTCLDFLDLLVNQQKPLSHVEYRIIHRDGSVHWYSANAVPQYNEEGQVVSIMAIANNIDERRQMEAILREREESFRAIFENAGVGIGTTSLSGQFTRVNQKLVDILGYPLEELLTTTWWGITYPDDVEVGRASVEQLLQGEADSVTIEKRFIRKDQTIIWCSVNISLAHNATTGEPYTLRVIQDITEQKATELALKSSEERFRATFEQAAVGISHCDASGRYIRVNQKLCDILGYTHEELVSGMTWVESSLPKYLRENITLDHRIFYGDLSHYAIEKQVIRKDCQIIWLYVTVSPFRDPVTDELYTVAISIDISDRKHTETALQNSEERFRILFEQAGIAMNQCDQAGYFIKVNAKMSELLGYTEEELLQMTWMDIIPPEELPQNLEINRAVWSSPSQAKSYTAEKRYRTKDGNILWTSSSVNLICDPINGEVYSFETFQDITPQKQAQEALQSSEAKLRNLLEASSDLVWETDQNLTCTYISPNIQEMMGQSPEEWIGRPIWHSVSPDDLLRVQQVWQTCGLAVKGFRFLESTHCCGDSQLIYLETSAVPYTDSNGQFLGFRGISRDITDRRRIEEMLRVSQERYALAVSVGQVGVYDYDIIKNDLYVDPILKQMLGFTELDIPDQVSAWYKIIHPDDRLRIRRDIAAHLRGELSELNWEIRMRDKQGNWHWFLVRGNAIWDGYNRPYRLTGSCTEISDRKRTEAALRESEERFRELAENIEDVFWLRESGGALLYVSNAYRKIWHSDADIEDWQKAIHPEDLAAVSTYMKVQSQGIRTSQEYRIIRPDGEIRWIKDRAFPVYDAQGKVYRVAGIAEDITDRKLADSQLRAALKEKETLLKEVHHRVKNNMQIISSLFTLQSQYITDPGILQVITESQARIRSMAMIHEKLYQSDRLDKIDFTAYVQDLVNNIYQSFASPRQQIRFHLDIYEILLNIETAIPCGLIINELVSNALKYAFIDRTKGNLYLKFSLLSDGSFSLRINDDGVGLPSSMDIENLDSLGLRLVKTLTRQLGGKLSMENIQGANFEIKFRELGYRRRV